MYIIKNIFINTLEKNIKKTTIVKKNYYKN